MVSYLCSRGSVSFFSSFCPLLSLSHGMIRTAAGLMLGWEDVAVSFTKNCFDSAAVGDGDCGSGSGGGGGGGGNRVSGGGGALAESKSRRACSMTSCTVNTLALDIFLSKRSNIAARWLRL